MPLQEDPRTAGRTIVRLPYKLARSKRGRKDRLAKFPRRHPEAKREEAHTARLFEGRCEHGHTVDPRFPFCRVCRLTEQMPAASVDYRPEPEGDWRFWPIDTLPLDPSTIAVMHRMKFMFVGELAGLPIAAITKKPGKGHRKGLCERAAERVKKIIWSLQRGEEIE